MCADSLDLPKRTSSGLPTYRGARIAAAYRLGVMRTEETVPELLKLLDKEKFGSSLFVIARSVAKSAAVIPHLKEMVNILAKHRKKTTMS